MLFYCREPTKNERLLAERQRHEFEFFSFIMFGFVAPFISVAQTQPKLNIHNTWKIVRKVRRKLLDLKLFAEGMKELQCILIEFQQFLKFQLKNGKEIIKIDINLCNLIFNEIQTIGQIFMHNAHHSQLSTKSLKTSLSDYKSFFNCFECSAEMMNMIFSFKQQKIIFEMCAIVKKYNENDYISIIEKQMLIMEETANKRAGKHSGLSLDRITRCETVLNKRTDRIVLVLDACYDIRNQMAMLRTAELYGIQNVFIVRSPDYKNNHRPISERMMNSITRNAQLWLTIKYFDTSLECISYLRENIKCVKIWVMDIGINAMEISPTIVKKFEDEQNMEYIFPSYLAIVLGREAEGPSIEFKQTADRLIFLPQFGFCESFNVSVACALMLNYLFLMSDGFSKLQKPILNENAKQKLRLKWYSQLANESEILESMEDNNQGNISEFGGIRRDSSAHWASESTSSHLRKSIIEQKKLHFLNSNDML